MEKFQDNGYTHEELNLVRVDKENHGGRYVGSLTAFCVRVPVVEGHSCLQ
ncbi:hypothetical protein GUA98_01870 [Paenibacillus sp. P13VS]|nr:hypothetical protein [Paenibacillus sp. P13VS]